MHDHQVFAVKFGEAKAGSQAQYFLNPPAELHEQPGHLDFCVWLVRTAFGDVVVDAGFTSTVAAKRNRTHFREPSQGVRLLGVEPEDVSHLLLSHFHYDHVGDVEPFGRARVVVQEREMAFWTGRFAARAEFRRLVETEDIQRLVGLSLAGRVEYVDGEREIVPGVRVHRVGGHTPGTQIVSVESAKGTVVLASDSAHLGYHVTHDCPAKLLTDLPEMYAAFDTIRALAGSPELVVPGHDPAIFDRFPAVPGLDGIAVRIA
ncbi:N-acyl homoserine lactonase family protein [Phytohabitans sp. ZYX-F-186]|uniref:N-acyl homoserine lactonase family protein n=1 Tax=Phytohabitans maris TaxID=3071409 RepID=A0ABU0ZES0_9ACTN|nr:N-acyl homoserine lactonase family protein [Phytohabitans sp. ZYX-F-186]MDQ7905554.1 N-acyl homoserine lactonase family protein [Phytohabitans sp. ZYX-F-186]